jgi:D-3-phosphoglycerate dehydrogenase
LFGRWVTATPEPIAIDLREVVFDQARRLRLTMEVNTMAFKVVYTSVPPIKIDSEALLRLGVDYVEKPAPTEEDLLVAACDADAVIARSEPCTRKVITSLHSCRLIFTPKVGYENIDVAAATEMGICVANMPGLSADEVSDHALALLLCLARKLFRLDRTVRAGQWKVFHGYEMQAIWQGISRIRGQTLGLIGFGSIARTLAPKARAFGLKVLAYDPYVPSELMNSVGATPVGLAELLKQSDYVSVHSVLTPETRHLLSLAQFQTMKPTAYLINASRGAILDEEALYTALKRGYIAGAGLDVLEKEPIGTDSPLLGLDNVILTGHSAHYSDEVWAEQARRPAEEVARILCGEWPQGWVNPQVEAGFLARWPRIGSNVV